MDGGLGIRNVHGMLETQFATMKISALLLPCGNLFGASSLVKLVAALFCLPSTVFLPSHQLVSPAIPRLMPQSRLRYLTGGLLAFPSSLSVPMPFPSITTPQ